MDRADSLHLLQLWSSFVNAVKQSNAAAISRISKDTVDCYCGISDADQLKSKWPAPEFSIAVISIIKQDTKLFNLIKTEKPHMVLRPVYGDDWNIYVLSFVILKPGELAPGHEGGSIFFEFYKTGNAFLLSGISTVP